MSREKKIGFSLLGAAVVVMLILAIYGYSTGVWDGDLTPR
jgi:hypothetical protein